jgi:hypothetical protein
MRVDRTEPTAQWLASSRRDHNAPDDWIWYWCSNPLCNCIVWCPPDAESATKAAGKTFRAVCGAKCANVCINLAFLAAANAAEPPDL